MLLLTSHYIHKPWSCPPCRDERQCEGCLPRKSYGFLRQSPNSAAAYFFRRCFLRQRCRKFSIRDTCPISAHRTQSTQNYCTAVFQTRTYQSNVSIMHITLPKYSVSKTACCGGSHCNCTLFPYIHGRVPYTGVFQTLPRWCPQIGKYPRAALSLRPGLHTLRIPAV